MRILIYSHSFWPSLGGVETYARLLAEGLGASPSLAVILATQTPSSGAELEWPFRIVRGPSLRELWGLVAESNVVLVAGPCLAPLVFAKVARKPIVIEHHGYQAICPNGLLLNKANGRVCDGAFKKGEYGECLRCLRSDRSLLRSALQLGLTVLRRALSKRASRNVAVSDHVRVRHGFPEMRVIYHGLPDLGVVAAPTGGAGSRVHFAYVGRLVEEKGLPLLVDAASRLRQQALEFDLSFIGDGPDRQALEKQVDATGLGSSVRFTGFLQGEALRRALAEVDVVVMPSVWEETAGLSAMEQMLRGRVVLAADIGGLGEVVGAGGLKFRAFDAGDLEVKMRSLFDPELRLRLGKSGRNRAAELFLAERMIEDHRKLIKQVQRAS